MLFEHSGWYLQCRWVLLPSLTCNVHFQSSKANTWLDCAKIIRPRWPWEGKGKKKYQENYNQLLELQHLLKKRKKQMKNSKMEQKERKTKIEINLHAPSFILALKAWSFLLTELAKQAYGNRGGKKKEAQKQQSIWDFHWTSTSEENWTTVHRLFCSTKPSPASLSTASQTVEETIWTQTEGSRRARTCASVLHAKPHLQNKCDSRVCASFCCFHQAPTTSPAFHSKWILLLPKMDVLVMNKNEKITGEGSNTRCTTVNKKQRTREILAEGFQEGYCYKTMKYWLWHRKKSPWIQMCSIQWQRSYAYLKGH